MRRWMQLWELGLLLLLSVGCGQASTTGGASSPSVSAIPVPTATPLFAFPAATGVTCPDLTTLGLQRALLTPADPNQTDVVLCDARDPSHPRLLNALARSSSVSFLSGGVIGYVIANGSPSSTPDQFTSVLRTLDLASGRVTDVASTPGVVLAASWSPDQSMVAYFVDAGAEHRFFFKRGAAATSTLATISHQFGRGGSLSDQLMVRFAPDGQYVAFVDTFVGRLQIFRTTDGSSAYIAPSGGAGGLRTMAAWTHQSDKLYFRNNTGTFSWDPTSGINPFVNGLNWYTPSVSSADRSIAYMVTAGDGTNPHVEIRDLSGGATVSSAAWRSSPTFMSESAILMEEDQACPAAGGMCLGYVAAGKQAVLHLDTRAESELPLAGWTLIAFWPHG